ncbi:MAG TPA: ABC transporter permease [Anaerolinea sp.]|nr:ABC transporter permease [Anaerolinea sp.]
MNLLIVLQAGVATGTILLFATLGELFAERSGVMNLGVEGMMLIGAMSSFSIATATGNPWLGLVVGMLAAGVISQVHAFISITLQADQVVSGLSLGFLATGIALVLGEGLSKAGTVPLIPSYTVPLLSQIPLIGPVFFTNQKLLVYLGYILTPLAWYYINHTRPGLHLRAVGEYPAAADSLGVNVYALRYLYVFVGGAGDLAGMVQRTDHRRAGLGGDWPGDLRAVGPAARGGRLVYLRRAAPAGAGHSGPDHAVWGQQPVLLQSLLGFLPGNAALRLHHHCAGDRLAGGDPQTPGRTYRARRPVYPRRTRVVSSSQGRPAGRPCFYPY